MSAKKHLTFASRYSHNRIDPRIKKMADFLTQRFQYVRLASTPSIAGSEEGIQLARIGEIAKINLILQAYFLALKEDTLLRARIKKLLDAGREWERQERNKLRELYYKE